MEKKLTSEQVKELIKKERKQTAVSYKDEIDLTVDRLVDLYESKKIDEATFKTLISLVLSTMMKDTISGLRNDLIKKNFLNVQASEPNKLLLINYSKESYA